MSSQGTVSEGGAGDGKKGVVYRTAAVAALGGLLFGYDTGVVSGALLFIRDDFNLGAFGQSVVVSILLIGAVLGALAVGPLSDRFGRRRSLMVSATAFIIGALLAAFAPGFALLSIARLVQGFAVGSAAFAVPLYISELSPAGPRGALVSLNQLMITVGILVAYLANYSLASAEAWRWMFALAVVPAIVLILGMLVSPETPRWLVSQGKENEARSVLSRSRDSARVEDELTEIKAAVRMEGGGLGELFSPWVRPALFVGITLALFQTTTGIDTILYYAPTILESTGLAAQASILGTVGIGLANVLMTVVAILLLDRIGRRPPLLFGIAGMALGLFVIGLAFLGGGVEGVPAWVLVLCLILFVSSFAIGLGPVFWLLNAEIYPTRVRGRAAGLATMVIFGSNAVVSFTFLPLIAALGETATFWLYGLLSVVALMFVYFFVPETKGRTLENIEADLRDRRLLTSRSS